MCYDLNVPSLTAFNDARLPVFQQSGFRAVANNVLVKSLGALPPPPTMPVAVDQHVRILHRLTIALDDSSGPVQAQLTTPTPQLSSWDLLAGAPDSEKAFVFLCEKAEIDIISLKLSERLPFKLRPQHLKTASQRGIVFELCCEQLLRDATSRRNAIGNAQALARILGWKHLLLTSGAADPLGVRSPLELSALYVAQVAAACC